MPKDSAPPDIPGRLALPLADNPIVVRLGGPIVDPAKTLIEQELAKHGATLPQPDESEFVQLPRGWPPLGWHSSLAPLDDSIEAMLGWIDAVQQIRAGSAYLNNDEWRAATVETSWLVVQDAHLLLRMLVREGSTNPPTMPSQIASIPDALRALDEVRKWLVSQMRPTEAEGQSNGRVLDNSSLDQDQFAEIVASKVADKLPRGNANDGNPDLVSSTGQATEPMNSIEEGTTPTQQRILEILRKAGCRMTTNEILGELEKLDGAASGGVVKQLLAESVRRKILDNRQDVRPRGYSILECTNPGTNSG